VLGARGGFGAEGKLEGWEIGTSTKLFGEGIMICLGFGAILLVSIPSSI